VNVVHIVESFSAGSFFFVSELTNGMTEHQHIIIHGRRDDTPNDIELYFPDNTRFYQWSHATREISIYQDISALYELIDLLKKIGNIDVIHLHSSKAGFLGRVAARLTGILTADGLVTMVLAELVGYLMNDSVYRTWKFWVNRHHRLTHFVFSLQCSSCLKIAPCSALDIMLRCLLFGHIYSQFLI